MFQNTKTLRDTLRRVFTFVAVGGVPKCAAEGKFGFARMPQAVETAEIAMPFGPPTVSTIGHIQHIHLKTVPEVFLTEGTAG